MKAHEALWTQVDHFVNERVVRQSEAFDEASRSSHNAELPAIAVSPSSGKFLHLLALAQRATRILEVGTLGGYSTIWLAKALPTGGHLTTIELNPTHASVARENIDRAGCGAQVEIKVGPALDILAQLKRSGVEPFDFVFIDADKQNIPHYFEHALDLGHPGTMIVVDNVVRHGELIDAYSTDERVIGVRQLMDLVHNEPRVSATVIQTVGEKGYDGMLLAVILDRDRR